ncbi:hypothetical protein BH10BAC3_BH10BAC3_14460 [soil metagenome]
MKKFFFVTAMAFIALTSCQKDVSNIASKPLPSIKAADPSFFHIKQDLTGFTIFNDCINEDMVIISGVLNLTTHQDGFIAAINIHNLVLQASNGTLYHGAYVQTFDVTTQLPDPGSFTNTFKLILTTPGGGNNFVYHGVFHITQNGLGEFAIVIDKFTIGCQ